MLRLAPPCLTPPPRNGRSSGSALVLTLAAFLVVVFMGALVIDGGLVYGKRAEIAKAVDAAAIAGISNLSQGQNQASQLAHDMFVANYRMTNRDAQPPDLDVGFGEDDNGNQTNSNTPRERAEPSGPTPSLGSHCLKTR